MQNIYFISGVGASKKLFSFLDLSFCNPVFIDWIPPLKEEPLQHYALRIKATIPNEHPVIVGISFGGMLASEIARSDPKSRAMIISSNKTSSELPSFLRLGNYLPIYKWIPDNILKNEMIISKFFFGVKGDEQKKLHKIILKETDIPFTKWAISAILKWKSSKPTHNIIHIHGTSDRLLPYRK